MTKPLPGESDDLIVTLLDDMLVDLTRQDDGNPHDRRAFIRTAFAAVEGHLAVLCDELLAKAGNRLTLTERMALNQEGYRVKENGEVRPVPAFQSLKNRVRLVTGIVSKLHPEYAIDFQQSGWRALLTGVDVRDRITHPKRKQDMHVGPDEVKTALYGVTWFLLTVISPGHESITAHLEKNPQGLALANLNRLEGAGFITPSAANPRTPDSADDSPESDSAEAPTSEG